MWKRILQAVVPAAIKTAETVFTQPGQGKTKLGLVVNLAQTFLLAVAGADSDVTHQEAANTTAIKKAVQEVFDDMLAKNQVVKLK